MAGSWLAKASDSDRLERVVTGNARLRRLARRFVAGDHLATGIETAQRLADQGRLVSLDHVGEHVADADQARAAAAAYRDVLDATAERELPSGISVKPSQLALASFPDLCAELLEEIAAHAGRVGTHVTLDMEDSSATEATVALVEAMHAAGHVHVGCAVQSYLHRTEADVVRLSALGASLRLCKGAYAEPEHVAYQSKAEIDASYRRSASWLIQHGTYPRFATHDHRIIDYVRMEATRLGRSDDELEFQMLLGVRPDLQQRLVDEGLRVCVYVPFGANWYAYFMRRLAERPANVLFFLRALRGPTEPTPTTTTA